MDTWATYWSGPTALSEVGEAIEHLASDQFGTAGVATGDRVYVISYLKGRLHVVTTLVVGDLVTTRRAEQLLKRTDLWEGQWHIIARHGSVRRATISAILTERQTASLVFIGADGQAAPPARNRHGEIDPQTFRTTRRIDPNTAAIFDKALSAAR